MAATVKVVSRRPLTFWEKIFVPEIVRGLKITSTIFFRNLWIHTLQLFGLAKDKLASATFQYPEKPRPLPERYRTRHRLMTAAALFELAPQDLAQRGVAEVAAERERQEQEVQTATYGTLVSTSVDLFARRPLRWVETRHGAWVLPVDGGKIRLMPDGPDTWQVQLHRLGITPQMLGWDMPLSYAQGVAEDTVRELGVEVLVDQGAGWRALPASERQLDYLRKLRGEVYPGMTRGEASNTILRITGDWD